LNREFEAKINRLINSDAVNYLETSERLCLKNALDKEILSTFETENLSKIFEKYEKFIKN
tara:strand:+ start:1109 stop:1288 length:180 start_codon:yes stop_codon:yes gene_type:complete